ncbi:protein RIC-3 [Grus japonensis]|uniref:Protein RIC-3 n=1 Tax=Grus japonensis TaxID=30415 RepID=A0ABC9WWK0_GRUJA
MEDPTLEQVEAPEGRCGPVGSLRWSKLLAGPVDPWREKPMPGQCKQDIILADYPDLSEPSAEELAERMEGMEDEEYLCNETLLSNPQPP